MKKPIIPPRFWTPEDDQFLFDNYSIMPIQELCITLNRTAPAIYGRSGVLGLKKQVKVPQNIIENLLKYGVQTRFQKGHKNWNKGLKGTHFSKETELKSGHKPQNTKFDGAIMWRESSNEFFIRISEKNWIPVRLKIWQDANGPVPKGFCVVFKDKNSRNCTLENLALITRRDNMLRNTIHRYPAEVKSLIRTVKKAKRRIKEHEEQND